MAHHKKNKKTKSSSPKLLTGRIEITRKGLAFVTVEGLERDIMIKHGYTGNALDGDEVKVEIINATTKKGGRMEGAVREVIRRRQTEFSGRLEVHPHFAFLNPDKANMPFDIFIPLHLLKNGQNGDHAVARIVEWTEKSKNPIGEIVNILTNESSNEIAMQSILMENSFPLHFPDEVMEDAARYPEGIDKEELSKRKDFRQTLTLTIDPVDAKDFDDAISLKTLNGGYYEIGVHIADVSHYMVKDSALDVEAYKRATSVYLPDRVLPMLPERLSNELCSLRPNEEKYTFSAVFEMNKEGKVRNHWLGRTVIKSQRRFSYEEVQEMIEGADGDHKQELLILNTISQNLRKERFKKGAINFSSQEVRFKLDENAVPIGIVVKESKEAHQLIEELMLLANRTVAEYVSGIRVKDKKVPFPYRVHDVPVEEKLKLFTVFAARFGIQFDLNSPEKIATSFNEMLEKVQGKPEQHVLESLGIRTMSKAVYTTDNIGHYGLGFDDYCHFTSPIRRYPDVLVHRILQECLEDTIQPIKHLEQQCRHCSDMERKAMEAERSANKYKQVEFMQQYVGDEFDAVVSGVSGFGFWAETVEHKCEGMISIADLREIDDFEMVEQEYALVGRQTRLHIRIGDKVKVQVVSANLDKRQIDFSLKELTQEQLKIPENKKEKTITKKRATTFEPAKRKTTKRKK